MERTIIRKGGSFGFGSCLATCLLVFSIGCGEEGSTSDAALAGSGSAAGGSGQSNQVPVIESVEMRPGKPAPGRTVQMSARISDPDGDTTFARFVWQTPGGRVLGEGRSFDTTGLPPGERLRVVVTASDGQAESEPYVHKFSLAEPSIEVGLVVIDDSQGKNPGATLKAVVESTNENASGYDVVYEWTVGGQIVGRDKELDTTPLKPGAVVGLRAKLDFGDRVTRAISARSVTLDRGGAPKILSQPVAGIEGGVFRYQIRARGGAPGAKLSYELLEGPEGMTVDSEKGVVTWRPREDQRGAFKIEVAAHDQWGSGAAQSFEMQVDGPATSPASPR